MLFKSKLMGAAVGLAALAISTQADASLLGDTMYINGNPYVIGSGPISFEDGWMPVGTDDYLTLDAGASWISVSLYAPDSIFYWNYTYGDDFTLSLTGLDWGIPGSYIDSISWIASGNAGPAGIAASLISGSAIDILIPADFDCTSTNCGSIYIDVSAYVPEPIYTPPPPPTYVAEPATLGLFGLSLAGIGFLRRRKSA
jgi:hypothetical protein